MDKIAKALKKLSKNERDAVRLLLIRIQQKDYKALDLKKLKGYNDIFRVRKGRVRIIFRLNNGDVFVLAIERRSDTTYNL